MSKRRPSHGRPPDDPLTALAASGDVLPLRRAILANLQDGTLDAARVRRVTNSLPLTMAAQFLQNLDIMSGTVERAAQGPNGEKLRLIAGAFTITITGDAEVIERVTRARAREFAQLLRVSGFADPDTNVLLMTQPYSLTDLDMLPASALFAGGKELIRISVSDRASAGAFTQIFPQASVLPTHGIVTRTFLGFTFNMIAEDTAHKPSVVVPRGTLDDVFNAYERAAAQLFGHDCVVGVPTIWPLAMESAVAMRLDDAFERGEDVLDPDTVEVIRAGAHTLFRLLRADDPDLAITVSVPTHVALRCPEDLTAWAEECLGMDDDLDEDDEDIPDQDDIAAFFAQLSTPEPEARQDDTTNLIPFIPRPRE